MNTKGGKYGAYRSDPEDYVFIYEAAEVLVKDEEARANKGSVLEVQLAPGNVCKLRGNSKHISKISKMALRTGEFFVFMSVSVLETWTYHQLAGDLRNGHAKGEQVQAAVPLKQEAG